jgi:hypothetical protein
VSVAANRLARWLDGFADRHGECAYALDENQVAVSAADGSRCWVRIPFGSLPDGDSPLPQRLIEHVERSRRVGVLLVRRGGYAVGVFDGATLVQSKVGSSYVQGTTKAGGWSQQRYARRRENQTGAAFARAADEAVKLLSDLDVLCCGGDRTAVRAVLADPRLATVAAQVSGDFMAVPDPRLKILIAAGETARSVRILLDP